MGGTINILGPTASPLDVTVSGGKFVINDDSQATLQLVRGETYVFNQEDNSNGTHPIRLSETSNGTHDIGGSSIITFAVPLNAPSTLYYKCGDHGGMGGTINILGPTESPLDVTVSGGKFVINDVHKQHSNSYAEKRTCLTKKTIRMRPTLYVYRKRVMEPTSPVVPDSILVEHRNRPLRWYVETRIRSTKRTRRMVHTFSKSRPRVMVRNIRVGIRPVRSLYLYRHQIHCTTNRVRRRVWVV